MADKPETVFRNRIRPQLYKLKNTTVCPVQQTSIHGTPDYLLCINGLFVALELKKDAKSKPTLLQTYNLKHINEQSHGISFVAWPENWQDIYSKLIYLSEGRNVQVKVCGYEKQGISNGLFKGDAVHWV